MSAPVLAAGSRDNPAAPSDVRHIQVFISSSSDVMPEREVAERVVARLDGVWKAHVRIKAVRWERAYYEAIKGFQEAIGEMADYDVVIGIIWKRIGSKLPPDLFRRADGSAYESGMVFELESAIASSEARGRPAVYLFHKTAPVAFAAESVKEDQQQYEALQAWWNRTVLDADGHYRRGYQIFPSIEAFEQKLETLLDEYLTNAGLIPSGPAWDVATKGSPYPGLLPYDGTYSPVFFGRALAVAGALEELDAAAKRDTPVLLIVGPSGSGKSSLVRAGLLSRFEHSQVAGVDFWRQVTIDPAQDPILAFAQRLYAPRGIPELAQGPQSTPEAFAALAHQSADAASQAIKWGLERAATTLQQQVGGGRLPTGRLLLVLDQLETVLDSAHLRPFARFVRALVESEAAWVIATLRSDRYADLQLDPDFLQLRRRSALFDLPPPGPSEIADIIKGPARSAELLFEDREGVSLAKAIGAAVTGADALPLLQMTLARLFEARAGKLLTYAAYDAIGGLEGAIAAHAEAVFATVSPDGQAALDALLRALVADIDDDGRLTVRTPDRAALEGEPSRELIAKLTEARLLVSDDAGLRLAHEALLRNWQRATASPALQPEAIRLRRQIQPNLDVWRRTGLDSDLLQSGTALAAAEAIVRAHPGAFPPDLDDYVRRSAASVQRRAEAETRKARWRAYAATGVAAVLAGLAVLVFRLYTEADHNFVLALLTRADQLLVEEKPSRALTVAGSLSEPSLLRKLLDAAGLSSATSDEHVRVKTTAAIAGPASSVPRRTVKHSSGATAASFNADGTRFALGYANGEVRIFRTDGAGKEMHLRGHAERVWSVRFDPTGKWLATASSTEILLWNLETGQATPLCDRDTRITDLAFDPRGRYLAWTTKDGRVSARSMSTGEKTSFTDHRRWALAVEFSPDGALLGSTGDDGLVVVRNTADWSVANQIETRRGDLMSLSFSAGGKRVATASLPGPVDVWRLDAAASEPAGMPIAAPEDKRWKVKFSADGRWLAIASWRGTVRLMDAASLRYAGTIDGHDHRVNDIAFTPDGALLLTASETGAARLWDLATMRPMFQDTPLDERETIVGKYSPDGSMFLTGGKNGIVRLYRVDERGLLHFACQVAHKNWTFGAAFSPDGREAVSINIAEGKDIDDDVIKLWRTDSCALGERSIDPDRGYVQGIAFSPTERRIAYGARGGGIWLAELDQPASRVALPRRHTGNITELDFSPDGRFLASAGVDGRLLVWDVAAKAVHKELRGPGKYLNTARFSPDGRLIASGGLEERIEVWDIARNDPLVATLQLRGGSNRLAFNQAGTILAVGSDARFVSMWSVGSWEKIFQLNALVGVRSVYGFHPTRGDLAFDGENGTVRVLTRSGVPDGHAATGVLRGMDVYFDEIPDNVAGEADATVFSLKGAACPVD